MSRFARVVAVLGVGAFLVFAPAGAAIAAQSDLDDFDIESFHSDFSLTRDADGHARLQVTETIVAVFPEFDQNKGFYRDIPEYRHGVQLHTDVASVVDEYGQPVPYTTEYYYDFFSVGLGDDTYVHGRQTYVITYSQVDVVESFADTDADEFYWDVNGTGWVQPFATVSMSLTVAPDLVPELTGESACYVLAGECREPMVRAEQADGSVVFTADAQNLVPNESLTVAVGFTAGLFVPGEVVVPPSEDDDYLPPQPEPSFWDRFGAFILGPAAVVVAIVAGATQVTDRSRRTPASDIIVPQYSPPDGLNVMVAAYIAGQPERAFAAQVVDLAVRGNVRLLDHPSDSTAPFEVQLLHADGTDLVEEKVLPALFRDDLTPGRRIPLGSTNRTLGSRLTEVFRTVDRRLKVDGIRAATRPTVLWSVLYFLSIAVAIVAGFDAFRRFSEGAAAQPAFSFLAVIVALWCASMTYRNRSTVAPLSAQGRRLNDHLLGMRDYMELAEEDRIRMLQSPEGAERIDIDDETQLVKLYERLLPYAIIFGIEDRWAKELTVKAEAARVPVTWWAGSEDFTAWRLNSTIQQIRRASPAPPRPVAAKAKSSSSGSGWGGWGSGGSSGGWSGSSGSSFSGGSSGGGFSGGGGGGGGGRGR